MNNRVLWLMPSLKSGGAEKMTINILSEINKYPELKVDLLLIKNDIAYETPKNIKISSLFHSDVSLRFKYPLIIYKLNNIFKQYDLIIIGVEYLYSILLLPILLTKKHMTIIHSHLSEWVGLNVHSQLFEWVRLRQFWFYFISRMIKIAFNYSDKIVVVADEIKNDLISVFGVNESLIVKINNGIYPSKIVKAIGQSATRKTVILSVGRLHPVKNYLFLIRLFKSLIEEYPRDNDLELVICGEGEEKNKLIEETKRLGIAGRVKIMGFVINIDDIYENSSIYIQVSKTEGFGLAILEALGHGLPVISSACLGPNEILSGSPLLIAGYEQAIYVAALKKLVNDHEHYEKIKRFSLERSKKYSLAETGKKYKELILGVLGKE